MVRRYLDQSRQYFSRHEGVAQLAALTAKALGLSVVFIAIHQGLLLLLSGTLTK